MSREMLRKSKCINFHSLDVSDSQVSGGKCKRTHLSVKCVETHEKT
jgi:hypothetical protein